MVAKWTVVTDSPLVEKKNCVISGGSIFVGRDPVSCSLTINKNEVSRRHAELLVKEDNILYVKDLDSANGTFVNDVKIPPNMEVALKDGSIVRFETINFTAQAPTEGIVGVGEVKTAMVASIGNTAIHHVASVSPVASGHTEVQSSIDVMMRMVLEKGQSPMGSIFNLDGLTSIRVGRNPDCDIVLNDPTVSGEHILLNGVEGGWEIINQSATNGMFINGHKQLKAFIKNNDEITIGNTTLRYESKLSSSGAAKAGNKIPDWMRQQGK